MISALRNTLADSSKTRERRDGFVASPDCRRLYNERVKLAVRASETAGSVRSLAATLLGHRSFFGDRHHLTIDASDTRE